MTMFGPNDRGLEREESKITDASQGSQDLSVGDMSLAAQRDGALKQYDALFANRRGLLKSKMKYNAKEIYGHVARNMSSFLTAEEFFCVAYDSLTAEEKAKFAALLHWATGNADDYPFVAKRYEALYNTTVPCVWHDYKHNFNDTVFNILSTASNHSRNISLTRTDNRRNIKFDDMFADTLTNTICLAKESHMKVFHRYEMPNGKPNWIWVGKPDTMYTMRHDGILFRVDTDCALLQRPRIKQLVDEYVTADKLMREYDNNRAAIANAYDEQMARKK